MTSKPTINPLTFRRC